MNGDDDDQIIENVILTNEVVLDEGDDGDNVYIEDDPSLPFDHRNIQMNEISSSSASNVEESSMMRNEDDFKKQITMRSIVMGVAIGALMCFSNTFFGLQSGFVTMGSLQSTLLGFLFFRFIERHLSTPFNHYENVLLQTISVATATMPLAGGFVGIIPALKTLYKEEHASEDSSQLELPNYFTWWGLSLWTFALAFFGVFFAVPLRKQSILVEKLKFPSGTATAQMIKVLHKLKNSQVHPELLQEGNLHDQNPLIEEEEEEFKESQRQDEEDEESIRALGISKHLTKVDDLLSIGKWNMKWKVLLYTFLSSAIYTLLSYFVPSIKMIPLLGVYLARDWYWALTPSLSYVGQGMIMGTRSGVSMFLGAVVGWAILGPIAKHEGWAPGAPQQWTNGAKGWILWISLFIMLSESMVSLFILLIQYVLHKLGIGKLSEKYSSQSTADPAPLSQRVPTAWWVTGLVLSTVLCLIIVSPLYHIKFYEILAAVIMALLTSVLAVRALGVTDLNPVSGIGKLSQILFAFIAPKNVLSNLVAGAIAEAGAQQAGDMMQDLKTGHLLKASPRIQFFGQLIGSFASIFFAVAAYALYSSAYDIPSAELPAPTSHIWLDMAKLVNGGTLATNVLPFGIASAVLVSFIPVIEVIRPDLEHYLPSGVAFGIGMYVTPNYTIARCIGTLLQYYWKKRSPNTHREYMIVAASGFVLGEGVTSILNAILATLKVPHFKSYV